MIDKPAAKIIKAFLFTLLYMVVHPTEAKLTLSQRNATNNGAVAQGVFYGNVPLGTIARIGTPLDDKCNLQIDDGKFSLTFWANGPADKPATSLIVISTSVDSGGEPQDLMPFARIVQKMYKGSTLNPMYCSEGNCEINFSLKKTLMRQFASSIQQQFKQSSAEVSCVSIPTILLDKYQLSPESIIIIDNMGNVNVVK